MSLRTPSLYVEIAGSTMGLYPYDLPSRPHWGSPLEEYVPYLAQTGFRNLEVHPDDAITKDVNERRESGDLEIVRTVIGSLHETFNDGTGLFGKVADRRGVRRSIPSIGSMMMSLQRTLPGPVPSVHYPGNDRARLPDHRILVLPDYPGSFPIFQPAAEVYHDYHITSEGELLARAWSFGHVGLCPDTVHSRRKSANGAMPPPIWEVWPEQFASGNVYQAHAAADRFDVKPRDPDLADKSCKEYKAFTSRDWRRALNTEMGHMIVAAVEEYVPPPALLAAVGAPVLRFVTETPPRPEAVLNRTAKLARFVENFAEIVWQTGATPLLWGDTIPRK